MSIPIIQNLTQRKQWCLTVVLMVMAGLLLVDWLIPALTHSDLDHHRFLSIRRTLENQLTGRKDRLIPLIVHMDEELEEMRGLPDDLRLAKVDRTTAEVAVITASRLRQDLARTREEARQALIRCDEVMEEFDTALRIPNMTALQKASRMTDIKDIPAEIQFRLKFESFKENRQ